MRVCPQASFMSSGCGGVGVGFFLGGGGGGGNVYVGLGGGDVDGDRHRAVADGEVVDAGAGHGLGGVVGGDAGLVGGGLDEDRIFGGGEELGGGGEAEGRGDVEAVADGEVHPLVGRADGAGEDLVHEGDVGGLGGEAVPLGVGGGGEEDDAAAAEGVDGDGGVLGLVGALGLVVEDALGGGVGGE